MVACIVIRPANICSLKYNTNIPTHLVIRQHRAEIRAILKQNVAKGNILARIYHKQWASDGRLDIVSKASLDADHAEKQPRLSLCLFAAVG